MKPRLNVITLASTTWNARSPSTATGWDWPPKGSSLTGFEDGAVFFFDMNDDLILALYPRRSLAKERQAEDCAGLGWPLGRDADV